ncbi:hypothetical protein ACIA58_07050 [Kribbella sp. NPDC051586]|uniref:hypothetical protein n=1 Tax=Kribbella sp. NPDC051586 TaxID=3364118 RepID=UPI0037B4D462
MTDVTTLLQELAGTGAVEFAEHDLLLRIRRRRRVRTALTAATGLAAATAVAIGAYAAIPGHTVAPARPPVAIASTAVAMPTAPYECGVAFPAPTPGGKKDLVAVVTLTQQSISRTATGWTAVVRSKYLYQGGLPHPLIAGLPPKWIAVVGNGRMVGRATISTAAEPVELHPGQSNVVDAPMDIRSCAGGPLPTGAYQLYEDLPAPGKSTEPVVDTHPIGAIQLR